MGEGRKCEARPSRTQRKVVMPRRRHPNRIGQGIDFDYMSLLARRHLFPRVKSIVGYDDQNHGQLQPPRPSRPTTDTSDRLYFEPLTFEQRDGDPPRRTGAPARCMASSSSSAARRPSKLGQLRCMTQASPSSGRTPDAIDLAEDRERFQQLVQAPRPETARERHRHHDARRKPPPKPWLPAGDPPLLLWRPRDGESSAEHRAARPLHPRRRSSSRATARCCSTATSTARSRSMSTRLRTARPSMSRASCSTSKRPACTPATAACSLPAAYPVGRHPSRDHPPDRGAGPCPQCPWA